MRSISMSTRLLNAVLKPIVADQHEPDRVFDLLVAKAEQASGGTAEGDESFLDGYRMLLQQYARHGDLTAVGWQAVLGQLQLRVQNRLRVRRVLEEKPEITREAITAPVFVVGLPRTATMLSRDVFSRSAGHRSPLLWEMTYTDTDLSERDRRQYVKSAVQLYKSMSRMSPQYRDTHDFDAERPDDTAHLLPHGVHHLSRAHLPAYRDWLREHDFRPDYLYLKRALQVLQHGRPGSRWFLHSPEHLDHLVAIREVFPDATIVWIHRDPVSVVGSLCSQVEATLALHTKDPDPHRIGATWLELTAASIDSARSARVKLPRQAIVDVPYPQLVAEPHVGVRLLYERLGAEWTEADRANLDAVLAGPGIGRSHEYELSRYGLSTDDVEAAFGDYPRSVHRLWLH